MSSADVLPQTLRTMIRLTVSSFNGLPPSQPLSAQFDELGGDIGRADTNQLVLPDPERTISRVHARVLFRANSGYGIVDQGSNAISVNGIQLGKGREAGIQPGDRIVSLNGRAMSTFDDIRLYAQIRPGEPVTILLDRKGQVIEKQGHVGAVHALQQHAGHQFIGGGHAVVVFEAAVKALQQGQRVFGVVGIPGGFGQVEGGVGVLQRKLRVFGAAGLNGLEGFTALA